jgi:hypothetical protein
VPNGLTVAAASRGRHSAFLASWAASFIRDHALHFEFECLAQVLPSGFCGCLISLSRDYADAVGEEHLLKVKGNPLFNEAAVLKAWLAIRKPDADSFVFNSQKSTQLNRVTIYKLFKIIAKKAGLGETLQHPHVLKHTTAMLMVQQGANAFMIRQHLGHRSFDSTLAYVNPSDADASAASAKAFSQVF